MSESLAFRVCQEEVKKAGSIAPVAAKIGYKRSSLNLYLLGKYPAKSVKAIENKIITTFTDNIFCPFAEEIISKEKCESTNRKGINTTNPVFFKLHQYCKSCPVKYDSKKEFLKKLQSQTQGENL